VCFPQTNHKVVIGGDETIEALIGQSIFSLKCQNFSLEFADSFANSLNCITANRFFKGFFQAT
jgi:hypothetical protein